MTHSRKRSCFGAGLLLSLGLGLAGLHAAANAASC